MIKATLNDYRQSPRKVRLVTDLVKGKNVNVALTLLEFSVKDAARPIAKLILSAISNAKNTGIGREALFVKDIQVNAGQVLKRRMPRARGSAFPIKKRTSIVTLILEEKVEKLSAKKLKKANKLKAKS